MDAEGKIIVKLPLQSGVSKAGNQWSKQEYVLETQEAYPKKIHFSFFGDRANQYPLEVGDQVRLSFDIDSHEYNGRWFNDVRAWAVNHNPQIAPVPGAVPTPDAAPMPGTAQSTATPFPPAGEAAAEGSADDLPF